MGSPELASPVFHGQNLLVGDINGDQLSDLLLESGLGGGITEVGVILGSPTLPVTAPALYLPSPQGSPTLALADVNGDGLKDLLAFSQGSSGGGGENRMGADRPESCCS